MVISSALAAAEAAIARGDYTHCLSILNPLSDTYPSNSLEGDRIRMLMVTAFMGQGDEQKAINICRLLAKSHKSAFRQEAKQLLSILEAPVLARPENWSIQIPNINLTPVDGDQTYRKKIKQTSKEIPNHPPTGPTKSFDLGFPTITAIVIIALTIFFNR